MIINFSSEDLEEVAATLAFSCFCEVFLQDIRNKGELSDEDKKRIMVLSEWGEEYLKKIHDNLALSGPYAQISGLMSELRQYVLQ